MASHFVYVNHQALLGYIKKEQGIECYFRNPITGKEHTVILNIISSQIDNWKRGVPIHKALHNISPEMRQLFTEGISNSEFAKLFAAVP